MIRPRWFVALTFVVCIGCDLVLARAHMPNSDTVQTLLEAMSALRHNLALHDWALGVDNFYFTDLPFTLILTALFGPRLWLIYTEPVLVLVLVVLAALLLVARDAPAGVPRWPGALAVLVLLGLPFTPPASVFLVAPIHVGTLLFCLLALLIIQPALSGRRINRLLLPLFVLLLFMASASDPLADVFFIIPLLLLMMLRLWLWPAWRADDALIFGGALSAVVAGALWPGFIAHHHGYTTTLNFDQGFVAGVGQAAANARAVLQGLQLLIVARVATLYGVTWPGLLAGTRLITLVAVAALCLRVIWRMPRTPEHGLSQLLVLGALCVFGADVMSETFSLAISGGPEAPAAAIRYVAPGFVLLVIAAICEAQSWNWRGWRVPAFGLVAALFCALSIGAAAQLVAVAAHADGIKSAPQYQLTRWLKSRGLRYGVSDYWSAQMITALSQGWIAADGVTATATGLAPFTLVLDRSRIAAGRRPQFAIIPPPNSFGITLANITTTYGPPGEVDRIGPYEVAILPPK